MVPARPFPFCFLTAAGGKAHPHPQAPGGSRWRKPLLLTSLQPEVVGFCRSNGPIAQLNPL